MLMSGAIVDLKMDASLLLETKVHGDRSSECLLAFRERHDRDEDRDNFPSRLEFVGVGLDTPMFCGIPIFFSYEIKPSIFDRVVFLEHVVLECATRARVMNGEIANTDVLGFKEFAQAFSQVIAPRSASCENGGMTLSLHEFNPSRSA